MMIKFLSSLRYWSLLSIEDEKFVNANFVLSVTQPYSIFELDSISKYLNANTRNLLDSLTQR